MQTPHLLYPSQGGVNRNQLLAGLGYFWNNVFKEKETLQGLTAAGAAQVVQEHYRLAELVACMSTKQMPVFGRRCWFPLLIKRSEVKTNLLLYGDGTVFGEQPSNADPQFAGQTFKFGRDKTRDDGQTRYYWKAPAELRSFSLIADKLVNPNNALIKNVDSTMEFGYLVLKTNPFELLGVNTTPLFNPDGSPATYTDVNNRVLPDETVLLWAYNAQVDERYAAVSWGWLFGMFQESSLVQKYVISQLINLYSNGPAINSIKAVVAAFMGVQPVIGLKETVKQIYTYTPPGHGARLQRVVETDLHVYKADAYYTLASHVKVGAVVENGDPLFDVVEVHDYINHPTWWRTKLVPKAAINNVEAAGQAQSAQLALPSHLFAGSYNGELVFTNSMELMTVDSNGNINFPVSGTPADVAAFNWSLTQNSAEITKAVGVNAGQAVAVNPLDFLFENFLKTGTVLVKINFRTIEEAEWLTASFKHIRPVIPKNVMFLFFLDYNLPVDDYDWLNEGTEITLEDYGTSSSWNADGTNSDGRFPHNSAGAAYHQSDPTLTLFSLSKGLTRPKEFIDLNTTNPSPAVGSEAAMVVREGQLTASVPVGKTTKEVNNLLLMTFG